MDLKLTINSIKNIKSCEFILPVDKGIYCIAGTNGSGKSTLLSCLAQTVYASSIKSFSEYDCSNESKIAMSYGSKNTVWSYSNGSWKINCASDSRLRFNGIYEGSLFYGTRFDDSIKIDEIVKAGKLPPESIVDADQYVVEKLSYILHGDYNHYKSLKRVRNRETAKNAKLKNIPYFMEKNGNLISQYRMSSGECLLISLLHFIYNALIRRSLPDDKPILMLIDEIELALHPIAVSRLIDLLQQIIIEHETLTVVLSSHSPEVIRKISPSNLFVMENQEDGTINLSSPCYPSYAVRDIYMHDGFDFVILVEDVLAKYTIEKIIRQNGFGKSRLINVLPIGGWENVLKFQQESYCTNVFGYGCEVFSVLDGDIKDKVKREYNKLPKNFLPIRSIEKYLLQIITDPSLKNVKKAVNDMFFNVESIDAILAEYNDENDRSGKALYRELLNNLEKRGISEESFIKELCDIIINNVDFKDLINYLELKLS